MATRSNQRAGRKKHTRTRARAKQVTSSPRTRTRATTTKARTTKSRKGTAGRSRSKGVTKAQPKRGSAQAKTTTDFEEIREWAEARGGTPASVRGTGDESEEAGILRIDFPGGAGRDKLEPISWEEWYDKFQEKGLGFLCQQRTKAGKISRFFKLVKI